MIALVRGSLKPPAPRRRDRAERTPVRRTKGRSQNTGSRSQGHRHKTGLDLYHAASRRTMQAVVGTSRGNTRRFSGFCRILTRHAPITAERAGRQAQRAIRAGWTDAMIGDRLPTGPSPIWPAVIRPARPTAKPSVRPVDAESPKHRHAGMPAPNQLVPKQLAPYQAILKPKQAYPETAQTSSVDHAAVHRPIHL